jgi:hypothetical protein
MNPSGRSRLRRGIALAFVPMLGLATLGWGESRPDPPSFVVEGPSSTALGTIPAGTYGRQTWKLGNRGRSPLRLRTRFTSHTSGFSLWQGQDHFLRAGEWVTASLTWLAPSVQPLPFARFAEVTSNDPAQPVIRLRVYGVSGPANPARRLSPTAPERR